MDDDLVKRLREGATWDDDIAAADRIEELEAKLTKAVDAFSPCVDMLDALVAESGRYVEYGEEDAFRMGEWFEPEELQSIEHARAALAELEKPNE